MKKGLSQYTTFIFDCDGVILDSNEIKSQGFVDTLKEYDMTDEQIDWAVEYHKANGGIPRDTKFFHIFRKFELISSTGAADSRESLALVLRACESYSRHVKDQVRSCARIPGIEKFLKKIPPQAYVYVVSGARQEELREALHAHGLAPYFQGIFGGGLTGKSKYEWLENIESWTGIKLSRGIYFGDSILDHQAASEYGMEFVFVHGATDLKSWPEYCRTRKVSHIQDFKELL